MSTLVIPVRGQMEAMRVETPRQGENQHANRDTGEKPNHLSIRQGRCQVVIYQDAKVTERAEEDSKGQSMTARRMGKEQPKGQVEFLKNKVDECWQESYPEQ